MTTALYKFTFTITITIIPLGPMLRSQSLFQFVEIGDACLGHLFWQYSPHSVIN